MVFNVGHSLRGYLIREAVIKVGGFSTVYKGYQDSIQRDVAIKIFDNEEIVKNVDFVRHFEIEAQLIARLAHPHIVPIYDYWREPDRAFIVLRWLDGGDIRSKFSSGSYLDGEVVRTLVTQIGSALHYVHQHGIVHRDLKPDNILLDKSGNYYLTDFGISIDLLHREDIEAEFMRIGTPDYMSPEQILGDDVTFKSDVYAFGILLYEILTHEAPFQGDTLDELFAQQVHAPFPSLINKRPDLPYELDIALAKATEKLPEDRYDSMVDFVEDILPLLGTSSSMPTSAPFRSTVATTPAKTVMFGENTEITPSTQVLDNALVSSRNPYKGLKAFDIGDAGDFYGRTAIIQQMIHLMRTQLEQRQPSFVTVVGASGSGKSSIVRAGLIPQLRLGELPESEMWLYIMMTPDNKPIETLAEKLNSIAIYGQVNLVDMLKNDDSDFEQVIKDMVGDEHILILIDQFEEVFTRVDDEEERSQFIDLLVQLSKSSLRMTVVITLRADFYDRPLAYRALGELIQPSTVTVLPMSSDELEQVIREPAKSVNCEIQPSLVSQLIADTIHEPNALPLLQFTVTELFEHRDDNILTLNAYEAMGRLEGSVAQRAETVYMSLSAQKQRIAQQLFLQLVILSDTKEAVRRRILWKDALKIANRADVEAVINAFGENRLLTFDREPTSRQPTIEVAHEALLQAWTRLQIWIAENRNVLMTYNRLMISVRDWLENNRNSSFLARDVQLMQYETVLDNPIVYLNEDEKAFIVHGQSLRRRNQWLRTSVVIALVTLTIASAIVSLIAVDRQNQADVARQVAVDERDRANREADISQSRALAATALNSRDDGRLALLMAIEANSITDTFEARDSLANILSDHQVVERYYAQDVPIRDFVVMSDGKVAYTVGDSGEILQWDLDESESKVFVDLDDAEILNSIALSPNETLVAIGGQEVIALFDVETGEVLRDIQRDADIWSIGWSSEGEILYGVDSVGAVFAIDVEFGDYLFDVSVSSQTLFDISVHPDGQTLAVGGMSQNLFIVDTSSGDVLYEFEGHSNWILSLAYSADGQLLASGGADLNLIVWDMENLQALGQIPTRHMDWIRDIAFSSDGSQMLTASADGSIKRWDVATGRQIGDDLTRHLSPIWSASFATNKQMLSMDRDGQLVSWSLDDIQYPMIDAYHFDTQIIDSVQVDGLDKVAIVTSLDDESSSLLMMNLLTDDVLSEVELPSFVTSMDYSIDKGLLAIAGVDQIIRLFDMSEPEQFVSLDRHDSLILDVAFSVDGQLLTAVDERGMLSQWDVQAGSKVNEIEASEVGVTLVKYLNSTQLMTADRDGIIVVWDAKSLEFIQTIEGGHDDVITDAILAQGQLLTAGRDGRVIVWNSDTWQLESIFPQVHTDWILDIALIDEKTLATTGRDSLVALWDIEAQQVIGQTLTSPSADWGVSILVDEDSLNAFSLFRDGHIVGWELSIEDWINHACEVANITAMPADSQLLIDDMHYCAQLPS